MGPKKRGDPDPFFDGRTALVNQAISACFSCTVRKECKEYKRATNSKYGVWGGEMTLRGKP